MSPGRIRILNRKLFKVFAKSNQEWENLLDKVGKEGIG
jgi:hypothetical protein